MKTSHDSYGRLVINENNTINFVAPVAGHYCVSEEITYYLPTGKYETLPNEARKWYEFWEPKFVTREIFTVVKRHDGTKIVMLKKGDEIQTKTAYRL